MHDDLDDAPSPASAISWPDGRQSAAALTFDLDAEAAVLAIDPTSARRMSVMSHQAYGPLTGVPRILALLARHEVRATFFVPGFSAVRYPDVVRSIADAGHEIAHHGYLHEQLIGVSRADEAAIIDRGGDALERVTGLRPVGYRAPMWELNYHTPDLLAERGFAYDSSLMDADVPYLLDAGAGLVEIPVHWGLDDWEQYAYLPGLIGSGVIESPRKVLEMWTIELAAMHREGGCFVLTTHPFLSGRPGRAHHLEQLVEVMRSTPGLWIAALSEIAAHVRTLGLTQRRLAPPRP